MPLQSPTYFGQVTETPRPFSYLGMPGWFSVPRNWGLMTDINMQVWSSPNQMTRNADGTISGNPLYSCVLGDDGQTYVFQDKRAQRKLNLDSPPFTRFTQQN